MQETFAGLGVALGIGFLLGLQREQAVAAEANPRSLGGIRTFPLAALLGAVGALLGPWMVGAGFLALLVLAGIAYVDDVRRRDDRGMTTEVAFILTYFLGVLALSPGVIPSTRDRLLVAAATGVTAVALLSLKQPLHGLARKISAEDMYATVKFAVLAVVALPLLPDRAFGPYRALNPFHIGLMVSLIAGLSFAGYVAVRALGPGRGLGVTGLLGGFASSTAVTLSFSGRAKREPSCVAACALGIVLASAVMAVRVLAEVAVVHAGLLRELAVPFAALGVAGLLASLWLWKSSRAENAQAGEVRFSNPFELGSAVKMGGIFVAVLLLSKAAQQHLGTGGIYAAALVAGTTDVDAITLAVARQAREGLAPRAAATAILLAVGTNTLAKLGMTLVLGGWGLGRGTLPAFLAMLAAGAAGTAWMLLR